MLKASNKPKHHKQEGETEQKTQQTTQQPYRKTKRDNNRKNNTQTRIQTQTQGHVKHYKPMSISETTNDKKQMQYQGKHKET